MDFVEAIDFSKKFPVGHPKVFKAFIEWGIWDPETDGYVVLTDAAIAKEPDFNKLEDYIKSHNLIIKHYKDYFMIYTLC
jgi:hypothetical protein